MAFNVGDRVIKNSSTWEPTNTDLVGRGMGVGEIIEPPFSLKDGSVYVRWPSCRCFEFVKELLQEGDQS